MATPFAVLLLIACACDAMKYEWSVDAPTRIQWESNGGYCGELSLIEAGLLNGQYVTPFREQRCVGYWLFSSRMPSSPSFCVSCSFLLLLWTGARLQVVVAV